MGGREDEQRRQRAWGAWIGRVDKVADFGGIDEVDGEGRAEEDTMAGTEGEGGSRGERQRVSCEVVLKAIQQEGVGVQERESKLLLTQRVSAQPPHPSSQEVPSRWSHPCRQTSLWTHPSTAQ